MADTLAVIPPPSLCRGHLHTRPSTRPYKHPSPPQGLLPGSIAWCNDAGLIPLRSGCVRQGFRFAHSPPRPSMLARKVRARSRIARRSAMLFPILSQSDRRLLASSSLARSSAVDWRRWENRERSEEHTSELQSLMRISYAVFCLKKNNKYKKCKKQNYEQKVIQYIRHT